MYKEEIFYNEGGETLSQVTRGDGMCPIPGKLQGQVGQGCQQPALSKRSTESLLGHAEGKLKQQKPS